jgi:hypothetical protein
MVYGRRSNVPGHGEKLGNKSEEAIAALLTHRTIDEAAKAVGVASKTLVGRPNCFEQLW